MGITVDLAFPIPLAEGTIFSPLYMNVQVLVTQSCLTLCDPVDCSPPGSSVHRILQARVLEWVAIPFSRDLPNPGIEPGSPALQADSLPSEPPGKPLYILPPLSKISWSYVYGFISSFYLYFFGFRRDSHLLWSWRAALPVGHPCVACGSLILLVQRLFLVSVSVLSVCWASPLERGCGRWCGDQSLRRASARPPLCSAVVTALVGAQGLLLSRWRWSPQICGVKEVPGALLGEGIPIRLLKWWKRNKLHTTKNTRLSKDLVIFDGEIKSFTDEQSQKNSASPNQLYSKCQRNFLGRKEKATTRNKKITK